MAAFRGDMAWASNFAPCKIWCYPSVEHAFQAMKFESKELRRQIAQMSAGQAKRFARTHAKEIREDWHEVKVEIMRALLERKFEAPDMRAKLVATGDRQLVELNEWHDNFWGDCTCSRCKGIRGVNTLGWLLMEIRESCK